jgi:hypothetical protein
MIVTNTKLQKNLSVFSNGSLLTTFVSHNLKKTRKIVFFEKDFKTHEKNLKTKSVKNIEVPNVLINYRKKLFT